MKKIILGTFFSLIIILGGLMGNSIAFAQTTQTSAQKPDIIYVAFGDSIAEGYAINLKTKDGGETLITGADEDYSFVENSYAKLIKNELEKNYNTTGYNFSYSGDTCQNLIEYLEEFYDYENNSAKNASANNDTYPTLTNGEIYENVANANIITVCIGANNVLSEASDLITGFLGLNGNQITQSEMEETCKDLILGNESRNIKGFKAEFNELLSIFNRLNPNAKIYFTNVYNPYKVLDADSEILQSVSSIFPSLTQENLNIISSTTEIVIGGGKDSKGEDYTGINNVIESEIENFNSNNFIVVNSKAGFDQKFDNTSVETRKTYNNYVNTRLDEITSSNIFSLTSNLSSITSDYLDPHPTIQGHELIFNAHKSKGLEVYLPIQTLTISFETNCGKTIQAQTITVGSKIEKPNITRKNHNLVGWFTDKDFKNKWNFNNTPTRDMTLYAQWEYVPPISPLATILIIAGVILSTLAISGIVTLRNYKKRVF